MSVVSLKKIGENKFECPVCNSALEYNSGGTGLGLSIAKWIADRHDIKISLESELGKGTKFILTMPLYVEENS